MTDEVKQAETQVVETPVASQVDTPATAPATQAATATGTGTDEAHTLRSQLETLQDELKKTRTEAGRYRTEKKTLADELAQIKARLEELDNAKLSEEERRQKEWQKAQEELATLKREREQLETARQEQAVKFNVLTTAQKLGIVDPDAAYALLDRSAVKLADDGTPENTEALLKALIKAKPYLLGAATVSPTNPARAQSVTPKLTDNEQRDRIYGTKRSVFDADKAKERGGGVFLSPD